MKELTIIIPVYNASLFLENCLDSIFNQEIGKEKYEVIIVNDFSTDNSSEIIKKYASQYKNLTFLENEKNIGTSASRNKGLEIAQAKYITFIDSDDEIFPNSLNLILERLSKENLDILYPEIFFISEKTTEKIEPIGKDFVIEKGILHNRRTYTTTFYKRELLVNHFFNEDISFGEDTIFNTIAQSKAERVSYISLPYYKYFNRENSLTKKAFSDNVYQSIYIAIDILEHEKLVFKNRNKNSDKYFENVQKIFVQRISELFIIKDFNEKKYKELISFLDSKKIKFLLQDLEEKYPFYSKSWFLFFYYQKYLNFKSFVYRTFVR